MVNSMADKLKKNAVVYCDSAHKIYGKLIRKQRFLEFLKIIDSLIGCGAYVSLTTNRAHEHSEELHGHVPIGKIIDVTTFESRNTFCEIRRVKYLLTKYEIVHIVSSWSHKFRIRALLYMYLSDEDRGRVVVHGASMGFSPILKLGSLISEVISSYKSWHYTIQRDYYENPNMDIPPEIIPNNKFRKFLDKLNARGYITHTAEPKQFIDKSKKAP